MATHADYRRHLNTLDSARRDAGVAGHREGRFRQAKRLYGDYLWHQDRERFLNDCAQWVANGCPAGSGI